MLKVFHSQRSDVWTPVCTVGEKGTVRLPPFAIDELVLEDIWWSPDERCQRLRSSISDLGGAIEATLARGVNADALLLRLLSTLELHPSPFEDDGVTELLCADCELLRACALVACRCPLTRARQVAREELSAVRALRALEPHEADALCERYCELLERCGPSDAEVAALAMRAQVWARHRLACWSRPRSDEADSDSECVTTGLRALEECARTGVLSAAKGRDELLTWLQDAPAAKTSSRSRRAIPGDIALEWRLTRRELAEEMAELKATGALARSLDARLATGHGMSLLSQEEYDLVHAMALQRLDDA